MKICPKCGRQYSDQTLSYCLDDGSLLLLGPDDARPTLRHPDLANNATEILPHSAASSSEKLTTNIEVFYRRPLFLAAGAVLVILAFASLFWYSNQTSLGSYRPDIRSIAVLPLENLTGDSSQEYFADGMTESLITNLSQIRSLKVISRTSVMRFKGSHDSLPDIARSLGVDGIIEGSVQRAGGRVKITVQLIPGSTDSAVWSRDYEREMSDILRLQSNVAQEIAGEIKARLTASEQQRLTGAKAQDPQATEEFLLGNYHLQKLNETSLSQAIAHYTRATEIDPTYAQAWAGLSRAWFERGIWGKKTYVEVEEPARIAATKAIELNPDLSEAHLAIINMNVNYDWDWKSAEAHAKRAIEIDPNSSEAYLKYGWFLLTFGRFEEMKQAMTTAEQLDPVSTRLESDFGRMLYRARQFDEAERHLKLSIELDENNESAYVRVADIYMITGRYDDAFAALGKAKELSGGPRYDLRRAYIYARMGDRQKALEQWKNAPVKSSVGEASLYTELGDLDEAFKALNRGLDQREFVLPHIRVDPDFDKLHGDPRWAQFLARMNLPPS